MAASAATGVISRVGASCDLALPMAAGGLAARLRAFRGGGAATTRAAGRAGRLFRRLLFADAGLRARAALAAFLGGRLAAAFAAVFAAVFAGRFAADLAAVLAACLADCLPRAFAVPPRRVSLRFELAMVAPWYGVGPEPTSSPHYIHECEAAKISPFRGDQRCRVRSKTFSSLACPPSYE